MSIQIHIASRESRPKFEDLRSGDTFMLPNGDTVYMVLVQGCTVVNLANGNSYDCFRGKVVVKLQAKLEAWPC